MAGGCTGIIGTMAMSDDGIRLSDEQKKRRRSRNVAIGLTLAGMVVLFYVITVVKLGVNVLVRPL